MAEKKNVRIRLFKDNSRYKGDLFVSVNGVNYKIRRGVEVEVLHFSVKQSFQGRIILDGGIELLIRRKRQARTGRFEETIAFIAMIISGCDKLLFLCFAGDGDAVVTQVLH